MVDSLCHTMIAQLWQSAERKRREGQFPVRLIVWRSAPMPASDELCRLPVEMTVRTVEAVRQFVAQAETCGWTRVAYRDNYSTRYDEDAVLVFTSWRELIMRPPPTL